MGASNLDISAEDTPNLSEVTDMSQMFRNASSLKAEESNMNRWDVSTVNDMSALFFGAKKFNKKIGKWNVKNVDDMSSIFFEASNFNRNIGDWNTGNVNSLTSAFKDAKSFNQDIGEWDVSSVSRMDKMFSGAESFNKSLKEWDTSNVKNMEEAFSYADNFNKDISKWDVSSVKSMERMFWHAERFNKDISSWNTENVNDMSEMFSAALKFNQNIGEWNTSNVTDMKLMFGGASNFNQDLGRWDVTSVTTENDFSFGMDGMFGGTSLSTENYDRTLIGWGQQDLKKGVVLGQDTGSDYEYCDSGPFRSHISDEFGWTFRDAGQKEGCPDYLKASKSHQVDGNGTYGFGNTATTMTIFGVVGSGRVTVAHYRDNLRNTSGISEDNISRYRLIIAGGSITFFDSTKVHFSVSDFQGMTQPRDVIVYRRPQPGYGTLTSLPTSVNQNGTPDDISDDTLSAKVTEGFGEFVFASNNPANPLGASPNRPSRVSFEITRTFGDASGQSDYRLVALPGKVDRPLGQTVSGEVGSNWQAFWDDGSTESYFLKYDGSDEFTFVPGRGFWLTSRQDWSVSDSIEVAPLGGSQTTSIPLHDGWNIISNPLEQEATWTDVQEANGNGLQPAWAFGGTFQQADTLRSAVSGQAYYFLNDGGLDSLKIPFTTSKESTSETTVAAETPVVNLREEAVEGREKTEVSLAVKAEGGFQSKMTVGIHPAAEAGLDPLDVVAPPGRFSALSLSLESSDSVSSRKSRLAAEWRPPSSGAQSEKGHTFPLRLQSDVTGPIVLEARGLGNLKDRKATLLRSSTGESYDLETASQVTLEEVDSTSLTLAVGSAAYVEDQKEDILPNEVTLTSYPNPVQKQATVQYTLPEAGEVSLEVYDLLGRRVATLVKGSKQAGRHQVRLRGGDLPSGVYFGRLEAGSQTVTQKITVVR